MLTLAPSKEEINNLIKLFNAQKYEKAIAIAIKFTKKFPRHPFGWKALGAIYSQTGNSIKAISANIKSIKINPKDAEAYSNLGNIYREIGNLHDAEINCRQAIKLKPDLTEAHNNLGIVLQGLENFKDAEECFKNSIQLNPNLLEARVNLGNIYIEQKRVDEAINQFIKTLQTNPNFNLAYYSLGDALSKTYFKKPIKNLNEFIFKLLEKKIYARPKYIARSILSLLEFDVDVNEALGVSFKDFDFQSSHNIIHNLCKAPLLLQLMKITPIPDLKFEGLFKNIRSTILFYLRKFKDYPDILQFQISLSLQCYVNEYLYDISDDEIRQLHDLENNISNKIKSGKTPSSSELLCLSSYKPLNNYSWCNFITFPKEIEILKTIFIDEPDDERKISAKIKTLKKFEDKVSREVRKQYEENPYPRWVNLSLRIETKTISSYAKELKLNVYEDSLNKISNPKVLIAGCGTGQNSIGTASIFSNSDVLGIDLSLKSLSYAQRKTKELGITNIKYMHADILDLELINQKFDIIESSGVLHHMQKPLLGWKVLTNCLKQGGLMRIALYSKIARRNIIKTRAEIEKLKIGYKNEDLRLYRNKIIRSDREHEKQHTFSLDFYSLSTFRDLLFHTQEHQFTINQINESLLELGLKFCGFDNKKAIQAFKLENKNENAEYDLSKWDEFEKQNQNTFLGMYQFWCQKI